MNQDQFLAVLKIMVPAVLPILVSKGFIPASATTDVGTAVLALGALGWGWWAHTNDKKIASVEAIKQVTKVVISSASPPELTSIVADPNRPKVVSSLTE